MKQHLEVKRMERRFVSHQEMLDHIHKGYTTEELAEAYQGRLEGAAEAAAFSLGWKLRELRLEAGMTQTQLAELVGIQQREITRIENGNGNPTLRTITRLLLAFGKNVSIVDDNRPS